MLSIFKNRAQSQTIRCPSCLEDQEISTGTISAYCKNCRSRIDINKIKNTAKQKISKWKPKTKSISCPFCNTIQEILSNTLSAYCKNCHQRISFQGQKTTTQQATSPQEDQANQDSDELTPPTTSLSAQKEITCPNCSINQTVPSTALSSFCSECGNRINLQNYEIEGRFQGELETKGNIYISPNGNVEGNINTGTLIVAGKFHGEIIAEGKVELRSTARLHGKIIAPALIIRPGAAFIGHSHIGHKN